MTRVNEVLIPSRFLLTIGHFVVVILALYSIKENVAAGLGSVDSVNFSSAETSLTAALAISIVCFIVQFYGLFSGATMFMNTLSTLHCVLHFFGGVLTAWFIIDNWGYLSYWPIMVFFNLLPTLMELLAVCFGRKHL